MEKASFDIVEYTNKIEFKFKNSTDWYCYLSSIAGNNQISRQNETLKYLNDLEERSLKLSKPIYTKYKTQIKLHRNNRPDREY